ncbi:hypothetical protein CFOL_v3_11939 [Cephalotus follicularis]|uniref:Knl1 C-terminal RWD domain-containing protein n=1 Tax=Cephalotus follicularis TaxID=3775 RepID=A0A1Q3BK77_CEPFO|nr:hypothetical protein CFOL_v3_11939 [Cephalotus follicularis]
MASKEPEEALNNTETEKETNRKKRSRRVSFAERDLTSYHIFDRDEEYETPPDSSAKQSSAPENELLGLFKDLDDGDDWSPNGDQEDNDDDDDYIIRSAKSFLRPIESPSGSSIVRSTTSNDEDNFFGPVSSNFIKPGCLSDSAASHENHDITMDSTAFSMHFRSLAKSESEGDLYTPAGVSLSFEEKSSSQISAHADSGSFMVFTKDKKLVPKSPVLADKVSGGRDSNDMSLVGENTKKYDYGRLSPTLEALLAECSKDMHPATGSNSANSMSLRKSEVSAFYENGSCLKDQLDSRDPETSKVSVLDISADGVSFLNKRLSEANGGSLTTGIEPIAHDCSANMEENSSADASMDYEIQTPNQVNKENKEFSTVDIGIRLVNTNFASLYSGSPQNIQSENLQLDLSTQQEPGHICLTEDWLKEKSSMNRRHNSAVDQIPVHELGSPLAGSISSLSAKRQQIFLENANSSKQSSYVTPSPRQPAVISIMESLKQRSSLSSMKKSNSRITSIMPPSYASSLKDALEKSKLRLLESLPSKASLYDCVMEDNMKNLQLKKKLDLPITNLEEHLLGANWKDRECQSMINMNVDDIRTTKDVDSVSKNDEILGLSKDGESPDHTSMHILYKEKSSKVIAAVASPAQFTRLGKTVLEHLMISENPKKGTLALSESNSPPLEITLDHSKDEKVTHAPNKFGSPLLVKRLDEKLSMEYQSNCSGDLKQQGQIKYSFGIASGQDENSIDIFTRDWPSTATAYKLSSMFVERRAQSVFPLVDVNHFKYSTQAKSVDDGESYPPEMQNGSESLRNFPTPSRDGDTLKFQSGSPEKNLLIATDLAHSKEELFKDENKTASYFFASPYICRSADKPSLEKLSPSLSTNELTHSPTWKEPTSRLSRIELYTSSHDDNRQPFVGKDLLAPQFNSDEHCVNDCHHTLQGEIPGRVIENSSGQKRKIEEIVLRDAAHEDEISSRVQTCAKVHKSAGLFMSGHSNGSNNGKEKTGHGTALKRLTDIYLKFSSDRNLLNSSLIDKLDIRAIGMLENMLADLQKLNTYEMLRSEFCTQQKASDHPNDVRRKRVGETRALLYKLVYEKAKLQLMHVKHERFRKRVQLLSAGIQETQVLKLYLSVPGERDARVNDNPHASDLVKIKGNNEVANDKVTTMRHEFEALERKIKNLTKSFHSYCKMKGEPNCADTIVLLKDHLKQRTCCRFICRYLQFWEVDDLERGNGHYNVVLDYHGFICQRFTINSGPVSSICISIRLNDINVRKNFPNMAACTAFAFVFHTMSAKKYFGSKSLAQETQSTSSLIRNLLDVVEEVQLARIEIKNLTHTNFQTPSAEQLDLELGFIDFNSGSKVSMTLDLTCLKCGIYPSEILPYQLHSPTSRTNKLMPHFLVADIKAAVESLRIGNSRILRLCRCVAQVVQSGSR